MTERPFPEIKHRSARIRKKLIKRFGGDFRRVPTMFWMGGVLVAHPVFKPELPTARKAFGQIGHRGKAPRDIPRPGSFLRPRSEEVSLPRSG